jgi:valyl-tRNA synthetase
MSKSKGNVIDPLEISDQYGTDAMRIALCSSVTQSRQIDLDRRRFDEYKNFANKIWNATRFILQNLDGNEEKGLSPLTAERFAKGLNRNLFTLEDNWILSKVNRTIVKENEYLETYQFDKAATLPYDFFWNDFCSNYLELVKPVLFGNEGSNELRENKQKLLVIILLDVIRLLHPIAPFITEEIFQLLKDRFENIQLDINADLYTQKTINALKKEGCIVAPYPGLLDPKDIMEDIESQFNYIEEIIRSIRNIRTEMKIPLPQKTDIYIFSKEKTKINIIKENKQMIFALIKTENICFTEDENDLPKIGSVAITDNVKIMIPLPKDLQTAEKKRLEKEKDKIQAQYLSIQAKLENKEFLEKAPIEIVENIKGQEKKLKLQLDEIENKLNCL